MDDQSLLLSPDFSDILSPPLFPEDDTIDATIQAYTSQNFFSSEYPSGECRDCQRNLLIPSYVCGACQHQESEHELQAGYISSFLQSESQIICESTILSTNNMEQQLE